MMSHLPLNKTLKIYGTMMIVRPVFHEFNIYYSQAFPDRCLYKSKCV